MLSLQRKILIYIHKRNLICYSQSVSIQQFKIQMSKKNTIFNPIKGPKSSFINELYQPYYSSTMQNTFKELDGLESLLTNQSVKRLYDLTVESLQSQNYSDAVFFADKLLTLSGEEKGIVYLAGQCYFHNGDYKKVHSLFSKHRVLNVNINYQLLAAKAALLNKQYDTCVSILDLTPQNNYYSAKLQSSKYLIRAQCCEAQENKVSAIQMYTDCLRKDPTSVEAFNKLMDCYMLTNDEKEKLLSELNFGPEDQWIKKYYLSRIKEQVTEQKPMELDEGVILSNNNIYEILYDKNNIDLLCIQAKNAFRKYDILKAYQICQKAIKQDPLYFEILPIYCACLLDLGYMGEMYYCAHTLVQSYPSHALSWFAIGTYYFLIKKYQVARKFYQKSLLFDRNFLYAWIGLAHSFAIQDESDQAMSVYRSVSRLFPGCHSAQLYMGMQYLRLNNKTALLALQSAKKINPLDPLVFNEIGSFHFKTKDYSQARKNFLKALELSEDAIGWVVEIILGNLAHCYRKMKDYKESIRLLQRCIQINPHNPHTLFSVAFVCHLSNQLPKAIGYYHKALKYKYDNQFAIDMLNKALSDASESRVDTVYNNL